MTPVEDEHDGAMPYIIGVDDAIIMSLYTTEFLQLGEGGDDHDLELEFGTYTWKGGEEIKIGKSEFLEALNKEIWTCRLLVSAKQDNRKSSRANFDSM
jgi:hypothetical protein